MTIVIFDEIISANSDLVPFEVTIYILLRHELPHAPVSGVQKGSSFILMTLIPYTKPHASAADRVAHLRSKGLVIPRPRIAAKKIELIGYERLRIYFLSRRQPSALVAPSSVARHTATSFVYTNAI